MGAYGEIARAAFRRYSRYRTAVAASAFTNTVFGLIRASLLLTAIAANAGSVAGYDAQRAATYVWLSQALLGPLDVWGGSVELGERVKSGDIAVDFARPVSILGSSLAANYGRAAFELLPRGLPPLVVGLLVTGLHAPADPWSWLRGGLAVVVATALTHCYFVAVHLSALWLIENRGLVILFTVLQQLLCGFYVPVAWFPAWLRAVAEASPFPSMFQAVADMFTEQVPGPAAWAALGLQVGWLAVMVTVALGMLALGRRRVVIQGG